MGVPSLEDHGSLRNVFSKDSKGPVRGVRYGSAHRAAGGGLVWLRSRASHLEPPQHFTSCAAGCEACRPQPKEWPVLVPN